MHHEREWPVATLILRGCSTLARRIAERRRPGQRQHIEVELPGSVLPTILRQRQAGGEHHDDNNGERTTEKRQTGHAIPPLTQHDDQGCTKPAYQTPPDGVCWLAASVRTLSEQNKNEKRIRLSRIYC